MGLNWLITGGCGFIGTSLIKRLQAEGGHNIRVIDNLTTGTRDDLAGVSSFHEVAADRLGDNPSGVELVVGDILDEELALDVTSGADVIVHLAANTGVGPSVEDPRSDCYANVIGTFNYLEAARKNKVDRFVFASSGAPAGEVEPPIHEELPPHPVSPTVPASWRARATALPTARASASTRWHCVSAMSMVPARYTKTAWSPSSSVER